jgi:type VII secretion protein EccB
VWTERDQIQAYQFLRRRLVSALAAGDANHPVSPSRRLVLGTVMGAVVVLLAAAGAGAAGLISPTSNVNYRQSGQVILEQGSGALFVFGSDGLLHPVINEASALLLAGADKVVTAPASALNSAPRGTTLGIPGAPDSLPSTSALLAPVLVSCSSIAPDQAAAAAPTSTLLVMGADHADGSPGSLRGLAADRGLLVQVPGGKAYLVDSGYQYQLPAQADVVALGYQGVTALPVAASWLDSLPVGRDLGLVAVPGAGQAGPAVGGLATRVGQVLTTSSALGGASSYYLVRSGGLEPITQTEALLVLADTANAAAYPHATPKVVQSSVADVASARQYPAGSDASGYPAQVPAPAGTPSGAAVVCAAGNGDGAATVAVGSALPLPSGGKAIPTSASPGDATASQVYVPPGSGALVVAQAAPGAPKTITYLITDQGMKFRVADSAALQSLGYGGVKPESVSPDLLQLLPTGPQLSPATAQAVVSVGSDG